MKVGEKVAGAMILIMLIPLIIAAVFSEIYSSGYSYAVCRDENRRLTISGAEILDAAFENALESMNVFVSQQSVRSIAEGSSDDNIRPLTDMLKVGNELILLEIIDIHGNVVYSTDPVKLGELSEMYTENSEEHNGISSVFMYETDGEKILSFSVSKGIFSDKNERIGTVYAVYGSQFIKNFSEPIKSGKNIRLMVVDSGSNIIEPPYSFIKKYSSLKQYDNAESAFIKKLSEPFDYKYQSDDYSVFSQISECSGWRIVGIANLSGTEKDRRSSISMTVLLAVLFSMAVIFVSIKFTSPLREIIKYLDKKKKGDISAHLVSRSSDEYGQIAKLFNDVFDSLTGSELRYRTIAEMSEDIVFEVNFSKNTVAVSNNFNNKFSFRPKDDSVEESFFHKWRIHKDDKDRFAADVEKIFTTSDKLNGEYRFKNKYGDFAWVLIKAKKLRDRNDNPYGIVGVIKDIDKEKSNELHLINKANYDALTQLFNRSTFIKTLSDEMELSRHRQGLDAVMFIDLDDFKHFNDEYGHTCGDEVLKFTADTIKELCFGHGFGGRFGGDEFIVCITGLTLIADAGKSAGELIRILKEGFTSESAGVHLSITCSIGIAFFGENGTTCDEVLAAADTAMYRIKKHGKSDFSYAQADDKPSGRTLKEGKPIDSDSTCSTDKSKQ